MPYVHVGKIPEKRIELLHALHLEFLAIPLKLWITFECPFEFVSKCILCKPFILKLKCTDTWTNYNNKITISSKLIGIYSPFPDLRIEVTPAFFSTTPPLLVPLWAGDFTRCKGDNFWQESLSSRVSGESISRSRSFSWSMNCLIKLSLTSAMLNSPGTRYILTIWGRSLMATRKLPLTYLFIYWIVV